MLGDGTVELYEDLMAFDDDPTRADLSETEIAERLNGVFQGGASLGEQFGQAEILDEGDPSA